MIFATPNRVPAAELGKLQVILALLTERKQEYEAAADRIADKWTKRTVLNLAQECNQYAQELLAQLETMSGRAAVTKESSCAHQHHWLPEEQDVLTSCQISEQQIITAYRNIVNMPVLDDNIRRLLHNQLNGIICAFMQVKLLNSSRSYTGLL